MFYFKQISVITNYFCMIALLTLFSFCYIVSIKACTRAVYLGEEEWLLPEERWIEEDPQSNIAHFSREVQAGSSTRK